MTLKLNSCPENNNETSTCSYNTNTIVLYDYKINGIVPESHRFIILDTFGNYEFYGPDTQSFGANPTPDPTKEQIEEILYDEVFKHKRTNTKNIEVLLAKYKKITGNDCPSFM